VLLRRFSYGFYMSVLLSPDTSRERPYLVLTKRRTGGTALMSLMARASHFPSVQHEPFNVDRKWGAVVQAFNETGDMEALQADLDECLRARPNIKHCYEIIPEPVTHALTRACVARNYVIFHLTRRDEPGRILSLLLAEMTGAWGESEAAQVYAAIMSGEQELPPLDLRTMRRRYNLDLAAEARIDDFLRREGFDSVPIVFEDFYRRDGALNERIAGTLAHLRLGAEAGHSGLEALVKGSGQNSVSLLAHLPNRLEVEDLLTRLRARLPR